MFKKLLLRQKEKRADKIVEQIVNALAEMNYLKISEIIDDLGKWSILDIEECAEGFKSINSLDCFDKYEVACTFKRKYEYHHLVLFP